MIEVTSLDLYQAETILTVESSAALIKRLKADGKTVGLCHGGFDVTHPGHVKHFECAKRMCDVLFVSITSDRFVTSRKGAGRPVYTDKLRAYMIANMKPVDYAVVTDFKKGVEVINLLRPSFYIKGPDFIHKTTPGITEEREAIKNAGGEIKYTTEPPMSTTKIIEYIKNEVDVTTLLLVIDRDGTLIVNDDFPGKSVHWREKIKLNDPVVSYLSYLQMKYKTVKVVLTNQSGVARRYFTCEKVEEINAYIHELLAQKGITIQNWQYCPYADAVYAHARPELNLNPEFIKEKTKRKPSTAMFDDALAALHKTQQDFTEVLVIGNGEDDRLLAENLKAPYIDVTGKTYEELVKEYS